MFEQGLLNRGMWKLSRLIAGRYLQGGMMLQECCCDGQNIGHSGARQAGAAAARSPHSLSIAACCCCCRSASGQKSGRASQSAIIPQNDHTKHTPQNQQQEQATRPHARLPPAARPSHPPTPRPLLTELCVCRRRHLLAHHLEDVLGHVQHLCQRLLAAHARRLRRLQGRRAGRVSTLECGQPMSAVVCTTRLALLTATAA